MRKVLTMLSLALLANTGAMAAPPVVPFKLAPSADLDYAIQARQRGFTLPGEALVAWRAADGKYSIQADTKSPLLGKIVENRSEGTVDKYGLAPARFYEKKFRKEATTTTFDRTANTIVFSGDKPAHPLVGGEQDRASAAWQLAAFARAAPDKFVAGSEWAFYVRGLSRSSSAKKSTWARRWARSRPCISCARPQVRAKARRSTSGWRPRSNGTRCACALPMTTILSNNA
jgi:hypothetical protein